MTSNCVTRWMARCRSSYKRMHSIVDFKNDDELWDDDVDEEEEKGGRLGENICIMPTEMLANVETFFSKNAKQTTMLEKLPLLRLASVLHVLSRSWNVRWSSCAEIMLRLHALHFVVISFQPQLDCLSTSLSLSHSSVTTEAKSWMRGISCRSEST